ncbi:LysM peptidoglycan-binding domain-containing protein [Mangrovibacterium sp.]|uniref:LysM peptidoglycan-binding domain-containing protein n=1 Tax=Mangrovibacterium sp. TaxID=1961364 RepID=UPI0035646EF6
MFRKYFILQIVCVFIFQLGLAQPPANDKQFVSYKVKSGETIYSISRAFGIEGEVLLNENPQLVSGLKAGQELRIPIPGGENLQQEELPSFLTYRVRRGNTLHYIAKRFGITVEDIVHYNPQAESGIKRGDRLRIPDKDDLARIKEKAAKAKEVESSGLQIHIVKTGETLYSISKKYNCSVVDILKVNPNAGQNLAIGMKLQIPSTQVESDSQNQTNESTDQSVRSDSFFIHLVESGETFWSLEQKYHTTKAELIDYNPVLREGLKVGFRIRIPNKNVPSIEVVPTDESAFTKYEVKRGETVYGLAKRFNRTVAELKRVNPVLDYRGLVEGETILIPNELKTDVVAQTPGSDSDREVESSLDYLSSVEFRLEDVPENCRPNPLARFEHYNVALLLPLYLSANDTINRERVLPDPNSPTYEDDLLFLADSFRVRENRIVYPHSESFVQFYEGVLLAVDSLKRAGMNVKLHVFDTDKKASAIQSILYRPEFRDVDLIIGPVFPELQGPVAEFARQHEIPMVSPLSSSGNLEQTNPYYFKISPSKEYLIRQTASYIADEYFDKNLIVLPMGEYKHLPEAELVNLSREKFFISPYRKQTDQILFHEYNLAQEGALGLSRILLKDQENVFIIPTETEAQLSVAVTNLNAIAENYPVTLVGLSNFQRYKSIQTEYYHHTNLNLLSPYHIDYKAPLVNQFLYQFRKNFCAEPNQFSFQGYDIAYYFMSAMFSYGKDFIRCLPYHQVELTQAEFHFEKVNRDGGYINQGLFILEYEPDYSIRLKGISGKPMYHLSETK